MIKNIVFDFGDVFINLDKEAINRVLIEKSIESLPDNLISTCMSFEKGIHNSEKFINRFVDRYYPKFSREEFVDGWNSILLDFPLYRLDFLKGLQDAGLYRLFLLSNTNDLHIKWIQNDWGLELYEEFKSCFENFYLSHEIGMRKPNSDIYEFVLNENKLHAEETFFIDDTKENTDAASALGIKIWNINPKTEDVIDLLTRKELNR